MTTEARQAGHRSVRWPEGRSFAFTVFDDPDGQSLEDGKHVYGLLGELGFRTTRGVWPQGPVRTPNSEGETCANLGYLQHTLELQRAGFEIGYHHTTCHSSTRAEIERGMDAFRALFGNDPSAMANHYNAEAIYWGPARLSQPLRAVYTVATAGRTRCRHFGEVEGDSHFWGDICHDRIAYCRNFVYADINTLAACPWMPYEDPTKPFVNAWYASTEGANSRAFLNALSEANQDRLEAEGGACIMYAHFGHRFVERGRLLPRFNDLMRRLSQKNGWFVPVSTLLAYLARENGTPRLTSAERRKLERRWLFGKVLRGTS
jgi:hypothetical protein